jgi:EpsI family protein
MHSTPLHKYLPFALLSVGYLFVFSTRSQLAVPLAGSLQTVLSDMAGYRITNQKVGDEERKIAGMSDYVARVYWVDSLAAFTTYVGYYDRQTQGKTMHSPRNCLPGAGWEILRADSSSITAGGKTHLVNKYLLKNGSEQALVFYWYQGRGRVVASEYAVKWNLLRDAALEGHTEEALVRIVVPVHGAAGMNSAKLDSAYVAAERLGKSVGSRLVIDVARVLPASKDQQPTGSVARAALVASGDTVALAYSGGPASRKR